MADYAPNYTYRYKVRYSTQGGVHTMQFRFPRSSAAGAHAQAAQYVAAFLTELESIMWTDWTILSAQYAMADSDIFLPATLPAGIAGTVDGSANPVSQRALALSFVGRSAGGHRGVVYVYGLGFQPYSSSGALDFRLYGTENANIADAATALSDGGIIDPVANDDEIITYYPYANVKYNDYWTRKIRG